MGNLSMRTRSWLAGALAILVFVVPTLFVTWQEVTAKSSQHPVTATTPGYALDTGYMQHCQSLDTNKSMDRLLQLAFLDRNEVSLAADSPEGHTWLDYDASTSGDGSLIVRYFADPSDEHPCTFALVKDENSQWDTARQRFLRAGAPFTPTPDASCHSSRPPFILPSGPHGENVATLSCDILRQN